MEEHLLLFLLRAEKEKGSRALLGVAPEVLTRHEGQSARSHALVPQQNATGLQHVIRLLLAVFVFTGNDLLVLHLEPFTLDILQQ